MIQSDSHCLLASAISTPMGATIIDSFPDIQCGTYKCDENEDTCIIWTSQSTYPLACIYIY